MGYFAQPTDAAPIPGRPAPLSRDRITAVLDGQGWNYDIDEDGDVSGGWDGHMFYFLRLGQDEEIFMIRGRWEARPGIDMAPKILPVLNDWHRNHIFPKAIVVEFPEAGNLRVFTEVTVDCEHGITQEQMLLHISAALNTSINLFQELDKAFPGLQETSTE